MKKIILLSLIFPIITLASCTQGVTPPKTTSDTGSSFPSPSAIMSSGALEFSQTGNVELTDVMTKSYRYLDSEKKEYSSGTLADIIKAYPKTVVYFYPKDGTPNCTIQALDFSMMLADFRAQGYNVIGISKDSIDSHKMFAERNELKIQLIQDGSGELLKAFGAEWPLQTYGNGAELSDIIRSTFVIDSSGKAEYAFRDVFAKGHARRIYQLVTGQPYTK